ncbi:2-oxoacid:acceptor oxidoreductase subunit alpha, partial [Bacillus sp. B-TM1]
SYFKRLEIFSPFPTAEIDPLVKNAKRVVVVENNATGQLANIMKMNLGNGEKISSLLKYDGNPFLPKEIYNECKKGVVLNGNI